MFCGGESGKATSHYCNVLPGTRYTFWTARFGSLVSTLRSTYPRTKPYFLQCAQGSDSASQAILSRRCLAHRSCDSTNISRRFALGASNVDLVGENPTCSVPSLREGARVYGPRDRRYYYPPLPQSLFEACYRICQKVRARRGCPAHKFFLVGCSAPFVRLAEHLTKLRAWCTRCLPGR